MLNKAKREECEFYLCHILRHKPTKVGLVLDRQGYVLVTDLLHVLSNDKRFTGITMDCLHKIVKESSKDRFSINGVRIRADYGHSNQYLEYPVSTPPDILYHGTHEEAVNSILHRGILKMNRDYVHSSETMPFAEEAGKRRGIPVLMVIDTAKARELGVKFRNAGGGCGYQMLYHLVR